VRGPYHNLLSSIFDALSVEKCDGMFFVLVGFFFSGWMVGVVIAGGKIVLSGQLTRQRSLVTEKVIQGLC